MEPDAKIPVCAAPGARYARYKRVLSAKADASIWNFVHSSMSRPVSIGVQNPHIEKMKTRTPKNERERRGGGNRSMSTLGVTDNERVACVGAGKPLCEVRHRPCAAFVRCVGSRYAVQP